MYTPQSLTKFNIQVISSRFTVVPEIAVDETGIDETVVHGRADKPAVLWPLSPIILPLMMCPCTDLAPSHPSFG